MNIEDRSMRLTSYWLPREAFQKLVYRAKYEGLTVSGFSRKVMLEALGLGGDADE